MVRAGNAARRMRTLIWPMKRSPSSSPHRAKPHPINTSRTICTPARHHGVNLHVCTIAREVQGGTGGEG